MGLSLCSALCAMVAIALALSPGPLYAFGVLDLLEAFGLLLEFAPLAATAAVLLGALTSVAALWRRSWTLAVVSAAACIAGLIVFLAVSEIESRAAANPLHDVTTDLASPPTFQTLTPRSYRPGGPEERAAYPHADWRARHAELYPDIATIRLPIGVAQAFERATDVAEEMGWSVEAREETGVSARIEAVDETGWFGFEDDIVVTIMPMQGGGTAVDLRSVSRIGIGDLGKNAARVRAFIARFEG